jgi:hypothetical protein
MGSFRALSEFALSLRADSLVLLASVITRLGNAMKSAASETKLCDRLIPRSNAMKSTASGTKRCGRLL